MYRVNSSSTCLPRPTELLLLLPVLPEAPLPLLAQQPAHRLPAPLLPVPLERMARTSTPSSTTLLPASPRPPPQYRSLSLATPLQPPVPVLPPSTLPPRPLPLDRLDPAPRPVTNLTLTRISSDPYLKDGNDESIISDDSTTSTTTHVRLPGTDLVIMPLATLPLRPTLLEQHELGTTSVLWPTTCWKLSLLRIRQLAVLLLLPVLEVPTLRSPETTLLPLDLDLYQLDGNSDSLLRDDLISSTTTPELPLGSILVVSSSSESLVLDKATCLSSPRLFLSSAPFLPDGKCVSPRLPEYTLLTTTQRLPPGTIHDYPLPSIRTCLSTSETSGENLSTSDLSLLLGPTLVNVMSRFRETISSRVVIPRS